MKPQNFAQWTHREMETLIGSVARYTRFVHSTKRILFLLVAFLTGLVLYYSLIKNETAGIRIAFMTVEKGTATPTQMMRAQYHGLDKNNQPFNFNSVTATQRDEDTMDLDRLTGDITQTSGRWFSLTARTGVFHIKDKLLDLKGAIEIFDDEGYEFRTETLHVNVGAKTAVTTDDVHGQGALGTLDAHGADLNEESGVMLFHGPVRVVLHPGAGNPPVSNADKGASHE